MQGVFMALSGGIGGAKLVLGLAEVLPAGQLAVVANTGDDFEHLGLHVSPDIDTLLYTLAGISNPETGWGRANESWSFMSALGELGADTWFRLGDKDLALNVYRTHRLRSGQTLTEVTADLAGRLGLSVTVVPMSDDPVRTYLDTDAGLLEFQEYFVRRQCEPAVSGIHFKGSECARPSPEFENLLHGDELAAVVICPSNPFLSIDPMLSIPGVRDALVNCTAPVIAVSPLVRGRSMKGPTAKIMGELGVPVAASAVAKHYEGLIDGFVLDSSDTDAADSLADSGLKLAMTNTVMQTLDDRISLARNVLEFAHSLR
jgi:LPPG:FO 2-phospho-L-lactate transferase